MASLNDFVQSILAEPNLDYHWDVLADWLEDKGDEGYKLSQVRALIDLKKWASEAPAPSASDRKIIERAQDPVGHLVRVIHHALGSNGAVLMALLAPWVVADDGWRVRGMLSNAGTRLLSLAEMVWCGLIPIDGQRRAFTSKVVQDEISAACVRLTEDSLGLTERRELTVRWHCLCAAREVSSCVGWSASTPVAAVTACGYAASTNQDGPIGVDLQRAAWLLCLADAMLDRCRNRIAKEGS